MNIMRLSSMALLAVMLVLGTTNVNAQLRRRSHGGPSYRIDIRNNIIRDSHGAVIGRYGRIVIHQDSTYIVPHTSGRHLGSYSVHDGKYYYYPRTAVTNGANATHQPQQIPFGGFAQADDLAGRLETLANDFCLDLHYNYSHNPGFRETYRDAYKVLQVAKYIHVAKHRQDVAAIRERVGGVDELFHHIQGEVRDWRRDQHRKFGSLGILSKMDLIESTIHHLMNDVGVKHSPVADGEKAPPPAD